ncbi:MAG: hypothetical protein LRZ84_01500 [Desertifilum sp.]|nr:hypothetical protein [Desertifilum sp.]
MTIFSSGDRALVMLIWVSIGRSRWSHRRFDALDGLICLTLRGFPTAMHSL